MRGGGILASLVLLAGATACEEPVSPNYNYGPTYGPGYYGPGYYGPGYDGLGYAYGPWPRPYFHSAPLIVRPHFHHRHFHHHHNRCGHHH